MIMKITPLHYAANHNTEIFGFIFSHRPELINLKNNLKQTPFEVAVGKPQILELIKKLI